MASRRVAAFAANAAQSTLPIVWLRGISDHAARPDPLRVDAVIHPRDHPFVAGGDVLAQFTPAVVRNFSIIAHVDHGKSTLADRLLEICGNKLAGGQQQSLDSLKVERERGITVRAHTVSLLYTPPPIALAAAQRAIEAARRGVSLEDVPVVAAARPTRHLLNLIDTPGHVDFHYEVSRALAACQGAVLLVDATQGIQAQTVANFYAAFEAGLAIVPVINKIDCPTADVPRVAAQMAAAFDLDPARIHAISAKVGLGLESLLPALVAAIPPPAGDPDAPLRCLLFDCFYDAYRGAVCLVAVVDGSVRLGSKLSALSDGREYDVLECGVLGPELRPTAGLATGQVGYIITGVRNTRAVRVGDTLVRAKAPGPPALPLPGFKPSKCMIFAGLFSASPDGFEALTAAVDKLAMNDASVSVSREASSALGTGFRVGFLGPLHLDVFRQRLLDEHGADVIVTAPTVPYLLTLADGTEVEVRSPADLPAGPTTSRGATHVGVREPLVTTTVVSPVDTAGALLDVFLSRRGSLVEHKHLDGGRVLLRHTLPLAELAGSLYDEVKSRSSGYASLDYEDAGYRDADMQRLEIVVNGAPVDALASIVHRSEAARLGRATLVRLKALLPRQLFEIALQAAAGGAVVARENVGAARKDVLAKCYGGDISRKKKLLSKQAEGKKRMRRVGEVDIPADAFLSLSQAARKT